MMFRFATLKFKENSEILVQLHEIYFISAITLQFIARAKILEKTLRHTNKTTTSVLNEAQCKILWTSKMCHCYCF